MVHCMAYDGLCSRRRWMRRGKEKGAKKGLTYRSSKVTGKDLVGR